jgi:hypothetical protein
MKEAFAGVLTGLQGLGSDDSRERPVDRLGALAAIQIRREEQGARGAAAAREAVLCALGKELIAFKGANRASAKADAEDILCGLLETYRKGLDIARGQTIVIARQAVMEFAIDFCPSCQGATTLPIFQRVEGVQPTTDCKACSGTGKRNYSDQERAAAMGKPYDKAMDKAHQLLATAEALALRRGKESLERW